MNEINVDQKLVSRCGYYCGACKAYLKEKCQGCGTNQNFFARHCKVKKCCGDNSIQTCAECKDFEDVALCKKLNSNFIKFFGVLVGYDRSKNIKSIQEIGCQAFAKQMAEKKAMWLPRK